MTKLSQRKIEYRRNLLVKLLYWAHEPYISRRQIMRLHLDRSAKLFPSKFDKSINKYIMDMFIVVPINAD